MNRKYAFFGSDEFSVIVLKRLIAEGYVPSLCITQPDKPKGRKLVMTPTPIREFCLERGIPCETPERLDKYARAMLKRQEWDFFVVASYGKIIPQSVLDIPAHGCLNVHPSLLPLYRGASPIETAILNDSKRTGVTIMLMDAQMDHGPILAQKDRAFNSWPTRQEIHDELAALGAAMLAETIEPFLAGTLKPVPQDHTAATFTRMLEKNDGEISLGDTDYKTYLKYVALTPWPGLFFFIEKQNRRIRVKIESAHFDFTADPAKGFVIDTVVPEGKSSMTFASFRNGYLV